MIVVIALYSSALIGSIGFFIWSVGTYVTRRRRRHRALSIELGPESEPAIFALYCQYLIAPQIAIGEAQKALGASRHRAGSPLSSDFFILLDQLQGILPAKPGATPGTR